MILRETIQNIDGGCGHKKDYRYCSAKCSQKYRKQETTTEYIFIERPNSCLNCGESIFDIDTYCSVACYRTYKHKNSVKEQ